jgi:hypothetical protein
MSTSSLTALTVKKPLSLTVEYLVVIDSSVYSIFSKLYGNLSTPLMTQYIRIFFSQLVNGVSSIFK